MDLRLQIDLLKSDGLERLGHIGYDRADVLHILGSRAYHLSRGEDKKSGPGGFDPVDQSGELFLVVLRPLKLGLDLVQVKLLRQLGGCHHVLDINCGLHTQVSPD